jgi:hypothetical protein
MSDRRVYALAISKARSQEVPRANSTRLAQLQCSHAGPGSAGFPSGLSSWIGRHTRGAAVRSYTDRRQSSLPEISLLRSASRSDQSTITSRLGKSARAFRGVLQPETAYAIVIAQQLQSSLARRLPDRDSAVQASRGACGNHPLELFTSEPILWYKADSSAAQLPRCQYWSLRFDARPARHYSR